MQNQHLRGERARRGGGIAIAIHVRGNSGPVVEKYELLSEQFRIADAGFATKVGELAQDEGPRLVTDHPDLGARMGIRTRPHEGTAPILGLRGYLPEQIEDAQNFFVRAYGS